MMVVLGLNEIVCRGGGVDAFKIVNEGAKGE